MLQCQQIEIEARLSINQIVLERGQCWHLLGPNGAGKTSFLSLVAGLLTQDTGVFTFESKPFENLSLIELAQRRCLLEQSYLCPFSITVAELLSFYKPTGTNIQPSSVSIPQLLEDALGITPFLKKQIEHLSGGENQRVQITRCLLQVWSSILKGNALILLDEPIASLDLKYQVSSMNLCSDLTAMGNLVVLSCHDLNISARYASHIALFKERRLVDAGQNSSVLTIDAIQKVFDQKVTCTEVTSNSQKVFTSA